VTRLPGRRPQWDEEVITVSAKHFRPPRTTRVARAHGLDGNPLRRATDRAVAWIRVGILAALLPAHRWLPLARGTGYTTRR